MALAGTLSKNKPGNLFPGLFLSLEKLFLFLLWYQDKASLSYCEYSEEVSISPAGFPVLPDSI
ncbi:hypothetical protein CIN01S_02_00490 [Chryseobacterium indologenes NBRC 14944]|nr:hypothetical protein CIN01S_02_00490 [Chryseobacterium indologenes NBRC 14944]